MPIVDGAGKIVNIVSQSTLVGYLNSHMADVGKAGQVTVGATGIGASPVITVKASDTVLTAFDTMSKNDIMVCGTYVYIDGVALIAMP